MMRIRNAMGLIVLLALVAAGSYIAHQTYFTPPRVLTIDALSRFTINQDNGTIDDVPRWIRALDGKSVTIHGQMWAPRDDNGFTCELTELNWKEYEQPLIQRFVKVHFSLGSSKTLWSYNEVEISGTLHVAVLRRDGHVQSIFSLDGKTLNATPPPPIRFVPYVADGWQWLAPFIAVATVCVLIALAKLLRRHRRVLGGLCPTCGYDLRFSHDRCTECGTPFSPTATFYLVMNQLDRSK